MKNDLASQPASQPYYVILTGSKNNAGDFLIKYRANELFKKYRPDRAIYDFNAWEEFDNEKLKVVNNSKALILMGGPALQYFMRPNIYKMTSSLSEIKVPILTMGIGWKGVPGDWNETYNYPLSEASLELLSRVEKSGFKSSVRDFHTLNALNMKGFNNFLMTGCPAYYSVTDMDKEVINYSINKISFSLGVSFIQSIKMQDLMKRLILFCKNYFKDQDFEVVFHHSLDKDEFLKTHNASLIHVESHNKFAEWLNFNKISYADISGSAENLIDYYSTRDLHIGFRVHAHIFMNSIARYSILLSEDGRAKGVSKTIGGIVLDGIKKVDKSFISKVKIKLFKSDTIISNEFLLKELEVSLNNFELNGLPQLIGSNLNLKNNFSQMKNFLEQLP